MAIILGALVALKVLQLIWIIFGLKHSEIPLERTSLESPIQMNELFLKPHQNTIVFDVMKFSLTTFSAVHISVLQTHSAASSYVSQVTLFA